ncbi:MAG: nucleoside hydrolase [Leifsonia sp.]|uniref:Nucleoside hydrolase n=1 Tax=Microcella pacifica TaxID=2591847 RepID=A0A9E5JL92_9MICO|nr:nucleoside hydrolase [Microcella pacifica]MBR22718.1 nucleoside hydrolase [Leifsonia sp.]NHF62648.1 nucleoside hydrolase [Microcella pacifica]
MKGPHTVPPSTVPSTTPAAPSTPLPTSPTVPLLVDVDTGIDDSLALLYLLASPEAEILGITCTAGNVPARQVAINNLAWLDLCDAPEIEVALGSEVPVLAPLMTTEETHGPQGIGYAELPAPTRTISERHATEVWIETARAHPGEVVGLVTGPLTNLALALRLEPELPRLLKRLVIMGGAFHHSGNTTPVSEWNIAVDPESAKMVFDAFSGLPADRRPIVCALDVTERIEMKPEHLRRIADQIGDEDAALTPDSAFGSRSRARNPVLRHLTDAVRFYFEFHVTHDQGWLAHMHDPFAAAVALHPELATLRAATVDVELGGTLARGQTIADFAGLWGRDPNAAIVVDTDPAAFFDHLIERVSALATRVGEAEEGGERQP